MFEMRELVSYATSLQEWKTNNVPNVSQVAVIYLKSAHVLSTSYARAYHAQDSVSLYTILHPIPISLFYNMCAFLYFCLSLKHNLIFYVDNDLRELDVFKVGERE